MGAEMSLPTISIGEAEAILLSLVHAPGSREESAFDPDHIRRAAIKQGATDHAWPISGIEDRSDSELLAELALPADIERESVIIIPNDSFRPSRDLFCKAFLLRGQQLGEFIRSYHARTGSYFFDGDTVFLFPNSRQIIMLHHEG